MNLDQSPYDVSTGNKFKLLPSAAVSSGKMPKICFDESLVAFIIMTVTISIHTATILSIAIFGTYTY